ncbi:MAG TPA: VOC family protein [Xanthomonadaceae bacterium]|jgi:predicted enzyme related to lactoylglutathione lyase|nr:VOC family protein [Xanthomonadaceae bacterium]
MSPTYANGKICYLEIPAFDVARSADFYSKVFGWKLRQRGDGATTFDDSIGEVSGAFVLGRSPMTAVGLLFYIMVDDAAATCNAIVAQGGAIVQAIGADAPEITVRFSDPAGNIVGVYQQPGGTGGA